MTNAEKFKTAKERGTAFTSYCKRFWQCELCPVYRKSSDEVNYCILDWLDLEAEEEPLSASEVANILAEYNLWRRGEGAYSEPGVWCPYTPKQLSQAVDRAVEILRSVKE